MDDAMPADPFREGQMDWGSIAAGTFSYFSAHLAAGFTEVQALELARGYQSYVLTMLLNSAAQQQDPGGQS